MFPYWLLFSYFALGSLVGTGGAPLERKRGNPRLIIGAVLIALMIGFRWRIGSDWNAYYQMFRVAGFDSLGRLIEFGDPGYMTINYLVQQVGAQFWLVNLTCGSIFAWGLYRLAIVQPDPDMAFLVAIPYLVVVVAMGYARQGVAVGLIMAALAEVTLGRPLFRPLLYVALAALFHKTAVVALPLALAGTSRGRLVNTAIVVAATVLLYDYILQDNVDHFVQAYIKTQWNSQGAAIRSAMCLIPATLFFLFGKRMQFSPIELKLWRNFSFAAFALLVVLFVVSSSTVADRLAVYILPLQVAVLSRSRFLLKNVNAAKALTLAYATAVLFVWLNYAYNAQDWLPYRVYSPTAPHRL